ncbi:DegV family protein [Hathewaya histolytica]|uniref:DegV family protein n=1 Tax=Hathewaya histolytica TaxID=1498 RepID=A0A4U9QXV5_HATHI|nr:DegV family protein [Hathewaya histolytica]VTQ83694.1 degV family protein [Hathewaya histolytica]
MQKIALITDSASDLSKESIERYNIHVLPFRIIYEKKEYLDKVNITPKEVYDNLDNEMPSSSLPALSDMEELFEKLKKEGYTHVIGVTLSSGLSGIYNALKLVSENHPEIESFIFDSKSISIGEGLLIEECGKMIEEGKSFEDIIKALPDIKSRLCIFFVVGTLKYLKKGGRIGKVAGTIGDILNLKPIITMHEDGSYTTFDKVRGRKQSLKRLVNIIEGLKNKGKVYLMHGNAEEEMKAIYESLKELPNVLSVKLGENISPVAGAHSGPGLVGVAYFEV